jgi:hypothetical protein
MALHTKILTDPLRLLQRRPIAGGLEATPEAGPTGPTVALEVGQIKKRIQGKLTLYR